jgi:hypothetical protein
MFIATTRAALTLVAPDLVRLQQGETSIWLCRPPRDLNFCDVE